MHKKIPESAMLRPDEAHAILGTDKISQRAFYNALKPLTGAVVVGF
jgi:hypothetical protein